MTDVICQIVKAPKEIPIKNADRIVGREIGGFTVITQKDIIKEGDKALFIGIAAILPEDMLDHYGFKEILKDGRVKTKKWNKFGVYSQGLLLPLTHPKLIGKEFNEGDKVADLLGVIKYEPPVRFFTGNKRPNLPQKFVQHPAYYVYDLDSIQHPDYFNLFDENDMVVVHEKVHGANIGIGYLDGNFFVHSRKVELTPNENIKLVDMHINKFTGQVAEYPNIMNGNAYTYIVEKYNLKEIVYRIKNELGADNISLRGEIYGKGVQDLTYGENDIKVVFYDIETPFSKYLSYDKIVDIFERHNLPMPPLKYRGKFDYNKIVELSQEKSIISKVEQISEGVVIKAEKENHDGEHYLSKRKILKLVNAEYLSRNPQEIRDQ